MLVDVNLRIRAVRGVSLLLKTQHADTKFKGLDINIKLFWYSNTKVQALLDFRGFDSLDF